MNVDLPTVLVLATALTGRIWLADAVLLAPRRKARAGGEGPREPILVEYSRSFFPVLLAVLVLRPFLAEPFRIPSGSIMPSLLVGDFILVNKFTYGLRLPVTDTKILEMGEPARGTWWCSDTPCREASIILSGWSVSRHARTACQGRCRWHS